MPQILNISNSTVVKGVCGDVLALVGGDAYIYDAFPDDASKRYYMPLKDNGEPVEESKAGYTKIFRYTPDSRKIPNLGSIYDFTNNGANTDVPLDLVDLSIEEFPNTASWLERFFARLNYDVTGNYIVSVSDVLITDRNEDPQSGACKLKTLRSIGVFPQYARRDNSGAFILDVNGNYIIDKYW